MLVTTEEHLGLAKLELEEAQQKLREIRADTFKLSDEVLAKTQQVKHYKKQADDYKTQLNQYAKEADALKFQADYHKQIVSVYLTNCMYIYATKK